jgi:uncharacterized protein with FMN-binding domain
MRRVILWLVATAIGTTVLVGAKAAPGTLPFGRSAHAPVDPAANDVATPSAGVTGTPAASTPDAKPGPSRQPTQPRTTAPAPATTRTILGGAYPARNFGDVQVKVVVTGKHIDDIIVVQMSNRPRNAPSLLRAEALAEQSADNLTNVSGATYTVDAYVRSLQSALAKV